MFSFVTKPSTLINGYKASSYIINPGLPIVASINKEKACKVDVQFQPLTINGYKKNLPSGTVKVTSGIAGKTQYRYAHTDFVVPDFDKYRRKSNIDPTTNNRETIYGKKNFAYFVSSVGLVGSAYVTKHIICKTASYLWFSQESLAHSKTEIDLSSVPEGKSVTFKWQGKPVFIKHRTPEEISEKPVPLSELRDPEDEEKRLQRPEWLIMIGICTHLGCIPFPNKGDYPGGYFCPCHGSHYDGLGRIRKGPAPTNMEIPPYVFTDEKTVVIG